MDNLRFALVALLCFLGFELYQAWERDYGPKPPAAAQQQLADTPNAISTTMPQPQSTMESATAADQRISVETDVLRLEISTVGGDIRVLDLVNYPLEKDNPSVPVKLLSDDAANYFVVQNGFLSSNVTSPSHHAQWTASAPAYRLAQDANELRVPLTWTNDAGVTVTKTYVFQRGSYLVGVEQAINNQSSGPWSANAYFQIQRKRPQTGNNSAFVRTYTGGVIFSDEDKYKRIDFDKMRSEDLKKDIAGGWLAMIQHYFLASWIPSPGEKYTYYTKALPEEQYVIGAYSETVNIGPGTNTALSTRLFVGPKLLRVLESTAPGLDLCVDYGSLTIFAEPIFWLLEQYHKLFGNWGWAIIFVTLTIKLLFFKLSETSYRSMANMRKLQPKLQELKLKFGDDKQKMNLAVMELYKKEKVNPLGGCFPILVQIPVFLSLYWVLIEAVELRQAPFVLWLTDLSTKDPFFILPILYGVSMFFQQRLNPPASDPVQDKIIKFFPVIFTIFFLFFPSGLVLYWIVNNLLSIAQQWYITRQIEGSTAKANP